MFVIYPLYHIHTSYDKLDDVQKSNILCILAIDGTRNGITEIPGFNSNELKNMLDSLSTH